MCINEIDAYTRFCEIADLCNRITIHFAGLASTKFSRKIKNTKISKYSTH